MWRAPQRRHCESSRKAVGRRAVQGMRTSLPRARKGFRAPAGPAPTTMGDNSLDLLVDLRRLPPFDSKNADGPPVQAEDAMVHQEVVCRRLNLELHD